MRPSLLFAFPLALAFTLVPTNSGGQQSDSATFELHGTVINSVTGQPVGGALVETPGRSGTFSGSDGSFTFTDVQRGGYVVMARKPGFFNAQELGEADTLTGAFVAVPSNADAVVKLTPEGIIYGDVKNDAGDPVENIWILAEHWQVVNGQRRLVPAGESRTDDEGNFRIAELKPGNYYLSFSETGGRRGGMRRVAAATLRMPRSEQGFGLQYYPGTADQAAATPISVHAGTQAHISQVLVPLRLYSISGTGPVPGATGGLNVNLMTASGQNAVGSTNFDRKTGQFRITGVPAGNYLLVASLWTPPADGEDRRRPLQAWLPITVNSDISGLVLPFGDAASIPIELHDESSGDANNPARVYVLMVSKEFRQAERGGTVPRTENGQPQPPVIDDVPPGTYSVEAMPQFQGYVADLRCGSVDLLRQDLTVAPGASVPAIEVTVRDDAAELDGTITQNGQPIGGYVALYSTDYPKRSMMTRADQGTFSIANIPPGNYQVFALKNADDLEFTNPAAMEKYLPHATSVTLGRRDKSSVQLQLFDSEAQQ